VAIEPARLEQGKQVFDRVSEWKQRHARSAMALRVTVEMDAENLISDIISNGQWSDCQKQEISETRRSITCPVRYPEFGNEVPVLVAGAYQRKQNSAARVLFLPGNEAAAENVLQAMSSLTPYAQSSAHQMPEIVALPEGMAAFDSGAILFTPLRAIPEKELGHMLIHTVQHAALPSSRPWISEGVAHLAQATLVEQQYGRAGALEFMGRRRLALALAEPDNPDPTRNSLINTSDEIFYRTKAMFVWWMLRDMVGDDALKAALAHYRPQEDREATYMQHLIETEGKRSLQSFFDDWVYRDRGLPEFKVTAVFPREKLGGGYLVTVTVENSGGVGAEVPVILKSKQTDVTARQFVPAHDKASIRIDFPMLPTTAHVNDGSIPESDPEDNEFTVPPKP